ncbi:fumarylacetoacetate hydrolase family protein [Nonomuraea jabiensis]|uniref:fumarylacetoacetate hydrolase family protein n=1 Tax=Nonomuraea jabiensis TaxID=882448 RepID=UPI0034321614
MKLVRFRGDDDQPALGVLVAPETVLDLGRAATARREVLHPALSDMQALIESGPEGLDLVRRLVEASPDEALLPSGGVTLLAPLPRPSKIRDFSCFEQHLRQAAEGAARTMAAKADNPSAAFERVKRELGLDNIPNAGWRKVPAYYYADVGFVAGPDEPVVWPAYSTWIDYELELAAVIGKHGKDISREQALDHVFGFTIFNDLSARDAQLEAMATGLGVAKGKDFDGSTVLGPCLVTSDEIEDVYDLTMIARLNAEEVGRGNTRDMFWRFEDCIEYASRSQTIHPGELFCSGTVGNGSAVELGITMNRGDLVELEIQPIGVLRTRIL